MCKHTNNDHNYPHTCPEYNQSTVFPTQNFFIHPQLAPMDAPIPQISMQSTTMAHVHAPHSDSNWPTYVAGINSNTRTQMCITVTLDKQRSLALWDTGAEISVMSECIYHKLNLWHTLCKMHTLTASACNNNIKFAGTVETNITIGRKSLVHSFCIWADCPFDVIIGTDLMKHCGPTSIDYSMKQLWFKSDLDTPIEVIIALKSYTSVPVTMMENVMIPPQSSKYICICCITGKQIPNTTIYFEGQTKVETDKHIQITPAVMTIFNQHTAILVSNWSQKPPLYTTIQQWATPYNCTTIPLLQY